MRTMPKQQSAGLLMFRRRRGRTEVLLAHPGGPYWQGRDEGSWTIPKGGLNEGESALEAARREFAEETGLSPPEPDGAGAGGPGRYLALTPLRQRSGKLVHAWAFEGDCDASAVRSNTYKAEWPPRSGRWAEFPEIDRAGWFGLEEARAKLLPGQRGFIDELARRLGVEAPGEGGLFGG
jgi:predicted NUDIX family NTP pyrophosphohydrolase